MKTQTQTQTQITFESWGAKQLEKINSRDVYRFMSQLTENLTLNPRGKYCRVYITGAGEAACENELMQDVYINVQIFNESNEEFRGTWTNHRAKNFSCESSGFNGSLKKTGK